MKNNQPVTNNEYVLRDTDSIVSKTDLQGAITYINEDFLRVSGFTESELIGMPHNIVRHPDMPTEAFADLWNALKAKRPWSGFVKNRCKNGDFYWVLANVTPIYENGQHIGFMSVRSKPTREQINAASAAYALFRNGQAGSLKIKDGQVVKPSVLGALNLFKNASIKTRLSAMVGALVLMLVLVGLAGLNGMYNSNTRIHSVYQDRAVPLEQIAEISDLMNENIRELHMASFHDPRLPESKMHAAHSIVTHIDKVEQNIAKISKLWEAYLATYLTPEEKILAEEYKTLRAAFVKEGLLVAKELYRQNKFTEANDVLINVVDVKGPVAINKAVALKNLQSRVAKEEFDAAVEQYNNRHTLIIVMIVIGVLLAIAAVMMLVSAVLRPVNLVVEMLQKVAQGNYHNYFEIKRQDEIAKLLEAIKSMQIKLGFDVAEALRISNENLRIRIGLDNVSTSVMISDTERKIIYMNKAVVDLMRNVESDLRKVLPNFNASTLMGSTIDVFHRNPSHQKNMVETLTSTHRTQIEVGGRVFALAANPVINERGTRLGCALEWLDRTTEVAVEREVASIVEGAVRGDFTRRLELNGKNGFFKQLSEGINQLMKTSDQGLQEVVRMLGSLAKGDLTDRIVNEYQGTFGQLKNDANATSEQLKMIIQQIKEATDTINTASKEIAMGNADLSQRTEEQASSLEETASSMEELTSTVKQNAENAKQANQLAKGASDIAEKGGAVVGEVVTTMDSINESSRKIVDIISVIDGIAFQTNILALNAAVEAARAGEQGRGFAVVAGEVRSLAQRSAAAAKEIKTLIGDSVGKVEDGSKLVAQAGHTMEEIVTSIKRVTDIMSEIAAASVEQSAGIEQVNLAITQMDEVTQQNAALVEEASAAAESLEEQAQNLSTSVAVFKIDNATNQISVKRTSMSTQAHPVAQKSHVKQTTVKAKPRRAEENEWEDF